MNSLNKFKTLGYCNKIKTNRNENNDKYDIKGRNLADLDMTEIVIYNAKYEEIVLMIGVES